MAVPVAIAWFHASVGWSQDHREEYRTAYILKNAMSRVFLVVPMLERGPIVVEGGVCASRRILRISSHAHRLVWTSAQCKGNAEYGGLHPCLPEAHAVCARLTPVKCKQQGLKDTRIL